jgi:hypothetical protein
MTLSEYFNKGREQELEYERRKAARQPQRKNLRKRPFYSPASILIGAGVMYQMLLPISNKTIIPVVKGWGYIFRDIINVFKSDVKLVSMKVTKKIDPDYETYKRFEELCRGER